jgi:hypothetical protein
MIFIVDERKSTFWYKILSPPFCYLVFISCFSSLLLRQVGFPCPHALRRLPLAGCIGFPPLGCLRCLERIRSIGFLLSRQLRCSRALWPAVRLHSCSPVSISLYCCVPITLQVCLSTSYPWTLYLDLTTRSWSRMLRGWQTRLPWSGLVISQVPKQLPPAFCSSTPILLPQECCERRSFLPACALAGLQ